MNKEFPAVGITLAEFEQKMGKEFWPGCACFQNEASRKRAMEDLYMISVVMSDAIMMNMKQLNICSESVPTLMALIGQRINTIAAMTISDFDRDKVPAALADLSAETVKKEGALMRHVMETFGCRPS